MLKILITSPGRYDNKGDGAILLATIEMINKYFAPCQISCLTTRENYEKAFHHEPSLVRINPEFVSEVNSILFSFFKGFFLFFRKIVKKKEIIVPLTGIVVRNRLRQIVKSYLVFIEVWLSRFLPAFLLKIHPKQAIRNFDKYDLIVMAGGTQLEDKEYPNYPGFAHNLVPLCLAQCFKKPVFITGQSIGEIRNPLGKLITKIILEKVDGIFLREEQSLHYLRQEMKISNPNVKVTGDWAFLVSPMTKDKSINPLDRIKESLKRRGRDKLIAIVVRKGVCYDNNMKKEDLGYLSKIAQVADSLIKENDANIILFPQAIDKNSLVHNDYETCEEVQKLMRNKAIIPDTSEWSVEEIAGFLGQMDLIITFRMHAVILSTTAGVVPVIAISHSHKFEGVMEMLGMKDLVLKTENFTLQELKDKIDFVFANDTKIKNTLSKNIPQVMADALKNIEYLKSFATTRKLSN